MSKELILVPSYGRDYQTAEKVLSAWVANKDFTIRDVSSPHNGRYINLLDVEDYKMMDWTFRIRYRCLADIVFIRYRKGVWKICGESSDQDVS